MEINNYEEFISYVKSIKEGGGYQNYSILLSFKQREKDLSASDYTQFKKFTFVRNYTEIDMVEVTKICNENKCRCYAIVLDRLVLKVLNKVAQTKQAFEEFRENILPESKGLHLIDIDEIDKFDSERVQTFLKDNGAKRLKFFNSKTGLSLVFYGKTELVEKYNSELLTSEGINEAHNICSINLYIPNFNLL